MGSSLFRIRPISALKVVTANTLACSVGNGREVAGRPVGSIGIFRLRNLIRIFH